MQLLWTFFGQRISFFLIQALTACFQFNLTSILRPKFIHQLHLSSRVNILNWTQDSKSLFEEHFFQILAKLASPTSVFCLWMLCQVCKTIHVSNAQEIRCLQVPSQTRIVCFWNDLHTLSTQRFLSNTRCLLIKFLFLYVLVCLAAFDVCWFEGHIWIWLKQSVFRIHFAQVKTFPCL